MTNGLDRNRARHGWLRWPALVLMLPGLGPVPVSPAPAGEGRVRQGLDLAVPHPPVPVPTRTGTRLSYELHLANFASNAITLTSLDILDASGSTVASLAGDALAGTIEIAGVEAPASTRTIAPGRRAIVYLDIEPAAVPTALRHRLLVSAADAAGGSDSWIIVGGGTAVDRRAPPELGPPLRGGPWAAVYSPGLARGHRRAVYAVDGRATIPGRHAIDWMFAGGGLAPEGTPFANEATDGGGAEVLAVADAIVAATRDDVPEPAPGAARPRVGIGDAAGNYVTLDLGDGRYVFYEHLRPGMRVRPGERVRRGQVIATVGSTGQATQSHLHFHVADGPGLLGAEGLPFVIRGFETLGGYASIAAFAEGRRWRPGRTGAGDAPTLPNPNDVVMFR